MLRASIMYYYWFVTFALVVKGVTCIRLVSLQVPKSVVVGDAIKLTCLYDMEGDSLYSIKWYRDDLEFFRFVPRDKPPGQFFSLKGVKVDIPRSTNGTVFIQDSDTSTTGTYKCEVSADAPSFQTVHAQKLLVVQEYGVSDPGSSSKRLQHGILLNLMTLFLPFARFFESTALC